MKQVSIIIYHITLQGNFVRQLTIFPNQLSLLMRFHPSVCIIIAPGVYPKLRGYNVENGRRCKFFSRRWHRWVSETMKGDVTKTIDRSQGSAVVKFKGKFGRRADREMPGFTET